MSGSKRGIQMYMLMADGNAVPTENVIDLLGGAMAAKADSKGYLIDGFPRGNFDDTPESVAKRITNYCTNTKPVIEKFNAMVINVERPADEIFAEVQKLF